MKNITKFRDDLRAWMATAGITQTALAKKTGVDQATLSRFLRMEKPEGLSGESVLRLYPLVYSEAPHAD